MKEKVVDYLMIKIKNKYTFDEIKEEEIRYGLLGIYSLFTKSIVIFIVSLLLDFIYGFLIFMAFYIPIRSVGFGAHAKSNLMCWIFSTILLIGVPYLLNLITFNTILKIIVWSIGFLSFLLFCPADTEKRPMINKIRKLKFKIVLIFIDLVYLVLCFKFDSLANYIFAAILLQAFLASPLGYIALGQKVRFKLSDLSLKELRKE